jgi:hypothetical protein|tara:strand:- start:2220 stop:2405 length:186 start_codon:yes stop_codon:yes gene_type:complete
MQIDQRIGTNINLQLRLERDEAKEKLEKEKIQKDIAIRKLNKALEVIKEQRKLIEHGKETK